MKRVLLDEVSEDSSYYFEIRIYTFTGINSIIGRSKYAMYDHLLKKYKSIQTMMQPTPPLLVVER